MIKDKNNISKAELSEDNMSSKISKKTSPHHIIIVTSDCGHSRKSKKRNSAHSGQKPSSRTYQTVYESMQPLVDSGDYYAAIAESMANNVSSMVDSIKPLAACIAANNLVTPAQDAAGAIAFEDTLKSSLMEDTACAINNIDDLIPPALGEYDPPILTSISEARSDETKLFDINGLFTTIANALFHSDTETFEQISSYMMKISDLLKSAWDTTCHSLHEAAHWLFHFLSSVPTRPTGTLLPPCHLSIKIVAVQVNIGLLKPEHIREFVVRVRKTFLQKHQRIGDDSTDMINSFLLVYATQ